MLNRSVVGGRRVTLGADRGYYTNDYVSALRDHDVMPHIAKMRHTTLDARTARHAGYQVSRYKRMQIG